jgi:WD40 repeat protein
MSFFTTLKRVFGRLTRKRRQACFPIHRSTRRPSIELLESRLCPSGDLLVLNFNTNSVLAFDAVKGTPLGTFASGGGMAGPSGIMLGPDGNVYVSGRDSNDVVRYDGNTGAFLGTFVQPGDGGLNGPHGLAFAEGHLYVSSGFNGRVLAYDAGSGAFQSTIAAPGSSSLAFPHGLAIGPDGNVYVGDRNNNDVLRYSPSGTFLGEFASGGGLDITTDLVFGPDGNLYVAGFNSNAVLRYDGQTGAFLGVFTSGGGLSGPQGLAFGPDGNLYVASMNTNQVLRYNGQTGKFMDVFASGGGLDGPTYLVFQPIDTTTAVSSSAANAVPGQAVTFTATVTTPPGLLPPTGIVTFAVDGAANPAVAVANGQATFTTKSLSVGDHTITATYSGDGNFNGSTSAKFTQTVSQLETTTNLTSSAQQVVVGDPVTLTATVTATGPGADVPTGTVTFFIDGKAQDPVALTDGTATLTVTTLTEGDHMITAAYSGDAANLGSSSAAVTLSVKPSKPPAHHGHHHHKHHHHHGHRSHPKRCDHDHDRDDWDFDRLVAFLTQHFGHHYPHG